MGIGCLPARLPSCPCGGWAVAVAVSHRWAGELEAAGVSPAGESAGAVCGRGRSRFSIWEVVVGSVRRCADNRSPRNAMASQQPTIATSPGECWPG